MIGAWRTKLERSVWPSGVVVGAELGEDGLKVPFSEDQVAVGELGPGGPDEAFGEAVRSRTARRDLHGVDAGAGEDGVEGGRLGNLHDLYTVGPSGLTLTHLPDRSCSTPTPPSPPAEQPRQPGRPGTHGSPGTGRASCGSAVAALDGLTPVASYAGGRRSLPQPGQLDRADPSGG